MARDFELLPDDGTEISADEALDAALGNVTVPEADLAARPLGRSWAFDFQTGQFVRAGQGPAPVYGEAALRLWIEKTWRTARFAHPIYTDEYGITMPDIIGRAFSPALAGQLAEAVTEALTVHDRIESVTDFEFTAAADDDALLVQFRVTLVGGVELEIDPLLVGGVEVGGVADPNVERRENRSL